MEPITLRYCERHKNWDSYECPDCMIDANAKDLRMEGMQVLADFVESHQLPGGDPHISIPRDDWYALLDKLGIQFKGPEITNPVTGAQYPVQPGQTPHKLGQPFAPSWLPIRCPGCLGTNVNSAKDGIKYICVDCQAEFDAVRTKCGHCGQPVPEGIASNVCGNCADDLRAESAAEAEGNREAAEDAQVDKHFDRFP